MTAQQLKNSILQMAVQGKLVPQDPNDEPASVLLERIRKEKEQLIKEGKIKREKNPSVIFRGADNTPYEKVGNAEPVSIADEVPFEIPDSWEWCRLGDIFYHNTGKALNSSNQSGQLLEYITTSNLYWNRFELDSLRQMYFTDAEIDKCTVTKGDLLVCEGGDIGRAAIWPFEYDIRIQNHIHRLRSYVPICTEFYYYIFYLYKHVGWIGGKGIGIQGLSANALHSLLFPLPPIEEQQRIVAKISEIKPYTEKYESAELQLTALNEGFPDQLKKSILQMAVQGKLVHQDPSDEPASVLLERIRAEKERLIKEGKIKRDKNESVIFRRDNSHYEKRGKKEVCIDDEIPFEIPDNWVWIRLGSALREIIVPMRDKPPFSGCIPWCRIEDRDGYYLNGTKSNQYVSDETVKQMKLKVNPVGTVLSASSGASIGTIVINTVECCTNQTFNGLVCSSGLYNWYLFWFLNSIIHSLKQLGTGTTLAYISQEKYMRMLFPLPPLNEQYRIVKRISELEQKLLLLR